MKEFARVPPRILAKSPKNLVYALIASWMCGWVEGITGFEKRFDNMGEVGFGMTFCDDAIVDRMAQRRGVVTRVDEIKRVATGDQDVDQSGVTRTGGVMR